jgi:hypothetical protein
MKGKLLKLLVLLTLSICKENSDKRVIYFHRALGFYYLLLITHGIQKGHWNGKMSKFTKFRNEKNCYLIYPKIKLLFFICKIKVFFFKTVS